MLRWTGKWEFPNSLEKDAKLLKFGSGRLLVAVGFSLLVSLLVPLMLARADAVEQGGIFTPVP